MNVRRLLAGSGPVLGLVLVVVAFTVLTGAPERFLSFGNLRVVLAQTVTVAIAALGMTLVVASGGIDLSVGSTVALGGVAVALGLRAGWSPLPAILAGVAAAGVVGVVNALAITRLGVVPFIATLGTLGAARGAAKALAGERTVEIPDTWVNELAVTIPAHRALLVAPGVWLALALAVGVALVLARSVFGRQVLAVGSNEAAARACGLHPDRVKLGVYALAAVLFGIAGVVQMSRLRQGDPTVAAGLELDVIAAVVIGGASLSGGSAGVAGSLVGALVMAFLRNGSQQMGWPTHVQEIIIGAVIVVAVAIDRVKLGGRVRRRAPA
jgi:ribose transport system permease protein